MKKRSAGIKSVIRGMERSALMSLICMLFAVAYPTAALAGQGIMTVIFRLAASLSFVAAGVISYITGMKNGSYGRLMLAGLAAGAVGDAFSDVGENIIVCMCFFAVGHILHIFAFGHVNRVLPLQLIIALLLGCGAAAYLWLAPHIRMDGGFWAATAYCVLAAFAVGGAVCIAVCKKQVRFSAIVCAVGVALVFLSSLVLINTFYADTKNPKAWNYVVALLHYPGQLCVGLSLMDEPVGI